MGEVKELHFCGGTDARSIESGLCCGRERGEIPVRFFADGDVDAQILNVWTGL